MHKKKREILLKIDCGNSQIVLTKRVKCCILLLELNM